MPRRAAVSVRITALTSLVLIAAAPLAAAVDPALLAGLEARSIGPAGMSGRIGDIDGVAADPDVLYVGAATGGLWKSVNGGLTWKPIFDDQPVAAIGAVAVFQPNPDVVWVGTGEGSPRNSVSVGNGVYKSLDGGRTWRHLGLEESERIHRILLHPSDPEVAYVAALGRAWGENPQRGVFKTVDGGKSWQKVLYVDERTGAADLAMDPTNPGKLLAAMWDYRRWPWSFRSGGPGSGLYLSHDGGESWQRLGEAEGLPAGELGRIGVAFCAGHPEVAYAIVEAETSALLRSDDGGESWRAVNTEPDVAQRPFYYADVRVDPAWPNRVYNLGSQLRVSDDGGRSFERLGGSREIHGDYQALWINPADPTHLVVGNDGGLAVSDDRGESWRFVANLPLGQFYHVAVDMESPYHVYGGMQDNGSWRGPSAVESRGGIPNHAWVQVGFGDGFDTRPDPQDSTRGYSMWQGGNLLRWDLSGGIKPIKPPEAGGEELRFNWNAGLALDPFAPGTLYYGSQYLHKSTDRGDSWTVISPDLTTDNPEWQRQIESGGLTPDVTGAENYTTIVAVAPSPVAAGLIWVGTDDGRLHLTRDGGETWTSVEENVPGVPAHTWIPMIAPSPHAAGEAYVVLDDHRRSNWTPYVYRTRDFGESWQSLATGELRGYALSIAQDPVNRDLLFLGTEFGLWVSTDGGGSWLPWTHGLPAVGVRDLVIHPREGDLVVATHGRAAYVLDDLTPLRELSGEVAAEALHLFPIRDAGQYLPEPQTTGSGLGAGEYEGENRPYGALISYWLDVEGLPRPDEKGAAGKPAAGNADGKPPKVEIEIRQQGETVRTFDAPAKLGLNRAVWDLGRDAFDDPPGSRPSPWEPDAGPQVPPGTYEVILRHGEHEATGTVRVLADPDSTAGEADWQAREAAIRRAGELKNTLAEAVGRLQKTREDVGLILARARGAKEAEEGEDNPHQELLTAGQELTAELDQMERRLWVPPDTKGLLRRQDVNWDVTYALRSIAAGWSAPTATDLAYLQAGESKLGAVLEELNRLYAEEVAAFRALVTAAGIGLLPEAEPLAVGGD